jgi:hypothetical protein
VRDLTDADRKLIRSLIRNCGRDVIAHEVATIETEPGLPGRPSKSLEAKFFQMIAAEMLDEAIAFAREAGERRPAEAVARAFYERESSRPDGNFQLYQKRLDQWRNEGKQHLRELGDDPQWKVWRARFYDLTEDEHETLFAIQRTGDAKSRMGIWHIYRQFYDLAGAARGDDF